MCDTIAVVSESGVLFAKNSDRDPNEAQVLDWRERETHAAGASLRCTHIEIPQVTQTHAVLLSRPFWMWGAEMGTNEHGVVIGNERVPTREKTPDTGLTGMDLIRLALERSRTAEEARNVITELIDAHGQGGASGFEDPTLYYFSSFIIADPNGALVLETAGTDWAAERIHGARSISNGLTIPVFAEAHSDRLKTAVAAAKTRQSRTQSCATEADGPGSMMQILRDHAGDAWPTYRRLNGTLGMACMHGGSEIVSSLSTASWVSRLSPDGNQHWATATSSPCLSLFKPVSVSNPVDVGSLPTGTADNSLWWTHERLHRLVMQDPQRLAPRIIAERDALESAWLADPPQSAAAFAEHQHLIDRSLDQLGGTYSDTRPRFVRRYWNKRNDLAGLATQ